MIYEQFGDILGYCWVVFSITRVFYQMIAHSQGVRELLQRKERLLEQAAAPTVSRWMWSVAWKHALEMVSSHFHDTNENPMEQKLDNNEILL